MIDPEIASLRRTYEGYRAGYFQGTATYSEMEAAAKVLVAKMNEKGKVIAKRFNRRYKPITVAGLMR